MLFQYVLSFSTSIKTNDGRMSFQIFKRTPRKILVTCVCVCVCVSIHIYVSKNVMKISISNFGKFDATEYRRCGAKLEDRENTAVLKFYDYRLQ